VYPTQGSKSIALRARKFESILVGECTELIFGCIKSLGQGHGWVLASSSQPFPPPLISNLPPRLLFPSLLLSLAFSNPSTAPYLPPFPLPHSCIRCPILWRGVFEICVSQRPIGEFKSILDVLKC